MEIREVRQAVRIHFVVGVERVERDVLRDVPFEDRDEPLVELGLLARVVHVAKVNRLTGSDAPDVLRNVL